MYYKVGRWLSDADIMPSPYACKYKRRKYNFAKPISKSKCNDNNFFMISLNTDNMSLHSMNYWALTENYCKRLWDKNQ